MPSFFIRLSCSRGQQQAFKQQGAAYKTNQATRQQMGSGLVVGRASGHMKAKGFITG